MLNEPRVGPLPPWRFKDNHDIRCHGHLIREYNRMQIWTISNIIAASAKDKCIVHSHQSPQITAGMRSEAWVHIEGDLTYQGLFVTGARFERS